MASDFAAMLDEMMGPERNVDLDKVTGRRRQFADPDVDKHHLAGCSPYALFRGTSKNEGYLNPREVERHAKMVCDDALRAEYEALPREEKDRLGYERDLYFLLEDLVARCDVRVRKAKEKLAEAVKRVEDKVNERRASWQVRIDEKMRLSEEAGEAGDIDRCQALVAEAEALREPMARACEETRRTLVPRGGAHNERACEISGAILLADCTEENDAVGHFTGKNYVAWKTIRDVHAAMKARYPDGPPPRPPPKRARSPSRDATFRDDRRRRGREGREGREGRSRERDGGPYRRDRDGGRDDGYRRDRERDAGYYRRGEHSRDRGRSRDSGRDRGRERSGERERRRDDRDARGRPREGSRDRDWRR